MVTGVSTGIGRSLCEVFAQDGAKVVGIARRQELGLELEQVVREQGGDLLTFVAGDVSRVEDCERLIATAIDTYGRVDFLVNNAAVHAAKQFIPTHRVTEAEWDLVVNTNLKGTFYLLAVRPRAHEAAAERRHRQRELQQRGQAHCRDRPRTTRRKLRSCSSRGTIAVEYFRHNIRCTAITLGGVYTPKAFEGGEAIRDLFGGGAGRPTTPRRWRRSCCRRKPWREAIALLCDDAAAPFFAAVVAVDGGATAVMESGGAYIGMDIAGALDRLDAGEPLAGIRLTRERHHDQHDPATKARPRSTRSWSTPTDT